MTLPRRSAAGSPTSFLLISVLAVAAWGWPPPVQARVSPITTLVSATPGGAYANGPSDSPAMSGDGSCVAFHSAATDLVADDTNGRIDVFVRQLGSSTTTRVSLRADGTQAAGHSFEPAVSHDCRYVAFTSYAADLVPGDTNGVGDVFIHDRLTRATTRVSVAPDGHEFLRGASSPAISADGRYVAFDTAENPFIGGARIYVHDRSIGQTHEIAAAADRGLRQPSISGDGRLVVFLSSLRGSVPGDLYDDALWLHDRTTGTSQRLATAGSEDEALMGRPAISADGRIIAFAQRQRPALPMRWTVRTYEVATGLTRVVEFPDTTRTGDDCGEPPCGSTSRPSLDGTGRQVTVSQFPAAYGRLFDVWVSDRHERVGQALGSPMDAVTSLVANTREASLSGDGRHVAYVDTPAGTDGQLVPSQVSLMRLDDDDDGLPTYWERDHSLHSRSSADATADTDRDGIGNLDEYRAGTKIDGFFRLFFAEGATSPFFATTFVLSGSGAWDTASLTFQKADGQIVHEMRPLRPPAPEAVLVADVPGMASAEFSTVIESASPLVADRAMTWDRSGYGGHLETGTGRPRTTWYFAEGATHSSFDLFYLLQNPSTTDATVRITYLLPAPASPVVKQYVVQAERRLTIWVDTEDSRLESTDVSAIITSLNGVAFFAERAMYATGGGRTFGAGHGAAGIADLAVDWFFGEGATGPFFDEFLTIANPGATATAVDITYLLPGGGSVVRSHQVAGGSRYTVWVDTEDPRLADTGVSAVVHARHAVPIAVERVMWWPGPTAATWYECHVSAGARGGSRTWAIADGRADDQTDMFVLIGNPTPTDAIATVTLNGAGSPLSRAYVLPAQSRVNAWINQDFVVPAGSRFSVSIESDAEVVVERSMYWDANGQFWAGGTAALAVPVPTVFRDEAAFIAATGASRRDLFAGVSTGTQAGPLSLAGLTLDMLIPQSFEIKNAAGSPFSTNYLETDLSFPNDILLTLAPGTTAAGFYVVDDTACWSGRVQFFAGDGRGAAAEMQGCTPQFLGFASASGVERIRIFQRSGITITGIPIGMHVRLGDVLVAP